MRTKIKTLLAAALLACGLFTLTIMLTGCANLGGGSGDLLGTLSGLGQFTDRAYQSYQVGVDAGQMPPSAEIADKYAQFRFFFDLFSGVMKPNDPPPEELVKAKTELVQAISAAKAEAAAEAKAKRATAKAPQ